MLKLLRKALLRILIKNLYMSFFLFVHRSTNADESLKRYKTRPCVILRCIFAQNYSYYYTHCVFSVILKRNNLSGQKGRSRQSISFKLFFTVKSRKIPLPSFLRKAKSSNNYSANCKQTQFVSKCESKVAIHWKKPNCDPLTGRANNARICFSFFKGAVIIKFAKYT